MTASWSAPLAVGTTRNASGSMGRVSHCQRFHDGSYASGSAKVSKWPKPHVTMYSPAVR